MDDSVRLPLLIVLVLLFLAALFAVTEAAFASVSRNRIKLSAERGDQRAVKAMYVLDNFDRAITTLLICTNIVHLAAASIVTVNVTRLWGMSYVSLSTLITAGVVFFAGEMLPKSIGKKRSESFVLSNAWLLCSLMKLLLPI
jgi:Mg2+/Co2+ transporter CorB